MKGDDKMKKIITALLAVVLVIGVAATVSFADAGVSEIYTLFADKQLEQNKITDDFGMEVIVTSYADDTVTGNESLILYVINHCGEYPGTEDDETIIADYLAEGYVVAVLDYQDAPLAVSPNIEISVQTIRAKFRGANAIGSEPAKSKEVYLGSRNGTINPNNTFVLPAGYRLARDVVYFELMTYGSQEGINATVKTWNTQESVAKALYNAGYTDMVTRTQKGVNSKNEPTYSYAMKEEAKAKTWEDIIMKDGSKMTIEDTQLKMDIIYPSQPIKETPVAVLASSGTPRGNNGVKVNRQHNLGFLFRGYTTVCYDHEYMAFMNTELGGWGHFEPQYTVQSYDGIKTHTAAIRCIKYHADIYGYSDSKIGVYGHSKSSYSSLLSNPESENLPEGNSECPALNEQPYLTDKNGNPIDASINCSYHSMGNGSSRYASYLTTQNVPTIICNGQNDTGNGNSYWAKEQAAYKKSGIEYLAIAMEDLGHDYPNGDDTVYDYNRYEAFCKFFDYYLKDEAPEILYTSVNDGQLKALITTTTKYDADDHQPWRIEEGDELFVQFVAPVTEWSFLDAVTLTDSNGQKVEGKWFAEGNGNRWIFGGELVEGESYTLTVADNTAADKYGRIVKDGITVTFTK